MKTNRNFMLRLRSCKSRAFNVFRAFVTKQDGKNKITSLYSNHTWLSLKECKLTIKSLHDIVQAMNDWAQVSSLDARKVK